MTPEIELKLVLAPGAYAQVHTSPLLQGVEPRVKRQVSTYFDSQAGKLAKVGCSLRVRRSGETRVQTLKQATAANGLFSRDEWQWTIDGDAPDLSLLADLPVACTLSLPKLGRKLLPVHRSDVERTSWQVVHDGSRLQVDLDVGTLHCGAREAPLEEVEFELLQGSPEAVVAAARELAATLPARLGVLSKAERGAALAKDRLGRPAKALPGRVTPSMTVAEALAAIVHGCLKQYRLNEDVVVADREAEGLHQARVALRRLRSAFTLFKPIIAEDAGYQALRSELRWFTNELGDARNLDVFLTRSLGEEERAAAAAKREQAYTQVIEAMDSARARLLILDISGWVAIGDWREGPRAARPIAAFAGKRLDKLWGTIEPTGRSLAAMDDESRHRLRIQAKKMRYAGQFFDGLHPASKHKSRFAEAIEDLQEFLGLLNDLVTARVLAAADPGDQARQDEPNGPHHDPMEEEQHLAAAEAALRRLHKAGPYWRSAGKRHGFDSDRVEEPSDA